MARKPPRPCLHPGCGALTTEGYCPQHRPQHKQRGARSQSWHRLYSTKLWTEDLRPAQLLAEPWCRECTRQGLHRVRATEVDHVVPHEGDWARFTDRSNLQSLCKRCHSAKTMRELNARQGKTGRKF